jgi:diacylglycerol O-acyltransferase
MERLKMLDAEFLHLEDESSPMHIAGLCVLDGPVPSRQEATALLKAKLALMPRYRKRVRVPFGELGRPVWVDDVQFDLDYHLRRTALPAPGDAAALQTLMGRLMAQRLDRDRPLWELWIVEGLEAGRWAMISKVHHSMVDGVSGVELLEKLLETRPDAPLPAVAPWTPEPEPSRAAMVLDAWRGLARDARRTARQLVDGLGQPAAAARELRDTAAGLALYARRLLTLHKEAIQGTVGAHRGYAFSGASLADVQAIRKALGGTVNDVVLAAASGAYRALLIEMGERPEGARLRSLVPVSVRNPQERDQLGNRVSALLLDLPVHLADPVERLRHVHAEMDRLKASHMAEAGAWLVNLGDLAPPMLLGAITRFAARAMHRIPQRSLATVTTNVPGPRQSLYCLGREMTAWYPYVPIAHGMRVGTAILSYAGRLTFGVTTDPDRIPDPGRLARGIEAGIAELLEVAREASRIASAA